MVALAADADRSAASLRKQRALSGAMIARVSVIARHRQMATFNPYPISERSVMLQAVQSRRSLQ